MSKLNFDKFGKPIQEEPNREWIKEREKMKEEFKRPETKAEKRRKIRLYRERRIRELTKKHENARKHGEDWDKEDVRDIVLNCRKDFDDMDKFSEKYERRFGSIQWVIDNRESLIKGIEKKSNLVDKDLFSRRIKEILEEENLI